MSHPMVTFADAVAAIGTLPSLAPRPCATNIRALAINLIDKLTIIPSEQTAERHKERLTERRTPILDIPPMFDRDRHYFKRVSIDINDD